MLTFIYLVAITAEAMSGALAAGRRSMDIFGVAVVAFVTALGGGTVRDLILDVPVFWIVNHDYLLICVVTAVIVYFTAHLFESRFKLLLWLDALGLAAYCVFGAWKALSVTGSPVIAVVMGVITASFGGILRDQLAGEPCILLRPEIYITAALAGAAAYTGLHLAGLPVMMAAVPAAVVAFAIRGGAMKFGWSIPGYKSRPGRPPDEIR